MASIEIKNLKRDLRLGVGRFVGTDSRRHYPHLYSVLEEIRGINKPAYLCGGAVRDLLLGSRRAPRDLDIIFGYVSREELATLFSSNIKGSTGLGGLKLQVKDWSIDMWSIKDTWAFKEDKVPGKGFSDYPETTFLDIDAIAIELFSVRRQKRKIYSKGFFEAISSRTIELNFEENPSPAKCIVRALQIANKFNFAIGPKLARFMTSSCVKKVDLEELAAIYKRRYTSARITIEKLHNCMKSIEAQLQTSNRTPVQVFMERGGNFFEDQPAIAKKECNLLALEHPENCSIA